MEFDHFQIPQVLMHLRRFPRTLLFIIQEATEWTAEWNDGMRPQKNRGVVAEISIQYIILAVVLRINQRIGRNGVKYNRLTNYC